MIDFQTPLQPELITQSKNKRMTNVKNKTGRNDWTMTDGLSREDQVLLHCARINGSPERHEALKVLLSREPDWELLLEKATFHRLSCLLSHHLRSAELTAFVPQPVLKKLQSIYYTSLTRNVLLQDELSRLLAALNREGIPVIVLKGAALLGIVYQDISLRPMSDLDILVPVEHLDRVEAVVSQHGYEHIYSRHSQEVAREKMHQLPCMMNREKHIFLEIHQHIVDSDSPYHFDLHHFWNRAQRITILETDSLTFAPEDLLIHLGIHFIFDRHYSSVSAIGQLCDISEVILHFGDSLDWDMVEALAEEFGVGAALHIVFYACEHLLGTEVPESVLSRLQPSWFSSVIAALFIQKRVLSTRDWVPLYFVDPRDQYSQHAAILAIFNKIFHIPARIFQEREHRKHRISYYLRLVRNLSPAKAQNLKQDMLLDRWLHDICNSTNRTAPHHSNH
ncbi:MAG: nucleotidyltransferase family protein [Dehalococcoidales bacterium]|nr:nucleotidyltransferase family protein [Dehalococcoidales bacterium]